MIAQTLTAFLFYPGLLLALALSAMAIALQEGPTQARVFVDTIAVPRAWQRVEGLLFAMSMVLAGVSLAFLPWPLHPAPPPNEGLWLLAWGAMEGAWWLALLPGLIAGTPTVVRASIREAQIGFVGRSLLWMALFVGLVLHDTWALADYAHSPFLAHLLAIVAAGFALPVAMNWGPFAPETSVTPGGAEQGLERAVANLAHAARVVRTYALLATSLVALLPVGPLNPFVGLVMLIVCFVGVTMLLKRFSGVLPRLSLPKALQACWWRVLPTGLAAVLYLVLCCGA